MPLISERMYRSNESAKMGKLFRFQPLRAYTLRGSDSMVGDACPCVVECTSAPYSTSTCSSMQCTSRQNSASTRSSRSDRVRECQSSHPARSAHICSKAWHRCQKLYNEWVSPSSKPKSPPVCTRHVGQTHTPRGTCDSVGVTHAKWYARSHSTQVMSGEDDSSWHTEHVSAALKGTCETAGVSPARVRERKASKGSTRRV